MKRQRTSNTLLAVALVAMLSLFVGYTPTLEAAPLEIIYWHTYTDQHEAGLLRIIEGFNNSQDQYKVVPQQQPYGEFDAKLMQAVRIGVGPDMVNMFASDAINYISNDLLVDLAPYINDPAHGISSFKENMNQGLYAEITQWGEDSIYLFPFTMTGEVLFYNKTIFDKYGLEAPTTWTELEEASKVIYDNEGIPGFGSDSITDTYQGLIMQAGSGYIDAETKTMQIDEAIAKEKLRWFTEGVNAGYFRLVGEDVYFSNPFGSQAVASYIGSSGGVSYVELAVGDAFEIGCVPIPQEGPVKYISQWASSLVCLSRDDKHARGVYEYFKYLSSTDVLADWATVLGSVPVFHDAVQTDKFQQYVSENMAAKALVAEMEYAGMLSSIPGSHNVRTEIDKMVQRVALGVMDVDSAYEAFIQASQNAIR